METGWTFAAIGCTIAQAGNTAKDAGGTAVGCFDDKRLVEGQSEDSTDMGFCLTFSNRITRPQPRRQPPPIDAAIALQIASRRFRLV